MTKKFGNPITIKEQSLGPKCLGNAIFRFTVWAPQVEHVDVHIISPREQLLPMDKDVRGYHSVTVANIEAGSLYYFRLNNKDEFPDPASRSQPQGVHGPSQITSSDFNWEDSQWQGIPLREYVIYELHVGTFTKEGTFESIIPFIAQLRNLGITALELMPVAQFPGNRNWGYDGVYPFAVQDSYGGVSGLKKLINACHKEGLCVILDVVYNHLGPEGNYLEQFGPYFTARYQTPWGKAINFDGPYSDEVRLFFIDNARFWFTEFHFDALRLDALHAIFDVSPVPFLEDLAASIKELKTGLQRNIFLVGESDANDRRLLCPPRLGGYGLDAQWNEDFHHSLHVLLTGETTGYYQDFGMVEQLAKAFREGFVYSGLYSTYRKRKHGSTSEDIRADKFVVFTQNHDQIGNRMHGERLSRLVSFDKLKLAAGIMILSPFIPLIFMGEEYGEMAPFQYFTSHGNQALIDAVRRGRRDEFAAFHWQGDVPDPQDETTFLKSKLEHNLINTGQHQVLLNYYKELFRLRREIDALSFLSKKDMEVQAFDDLKLLYVRRWKGSCETIVISNFASRSILVRLPFPEGKWDKALDSTDEKWLGHGNTGLDNYISEGELKLKLKANAFLLFIRRKET